MAERERPIIDVDYELVRGPRRRLRRAPAWLQQGPARLGPLAWATNGRMLLFFILITPVLVVGGLILVFGGLTWLRLRLP